MNDTGKCNPIKPVHCIKGDLICPSIAHCKINCKSGPSLPIEKRSCKIRQCTLPHNSLRVRVIDPPQHHESSLCDPVKGLPLECGE